MTDAPGVTDKIMWQMGIIINDEFYPLLSDQRQTLGFHFFDDHPSATMEDWDALTAEHEEGGAADREE